MSKRYTFYLKTKEKTYKFNFTWARGRFIDEVEDEKGTCKGVCYYKDNKTGEIVIQYCMFDNGYKNEEGRLKAFREYFKDILPELGGMKNDKARNLQDSYRKCKERAQMGRAKPKRS